MHNLLVAQSGGPTSAINATLSGVITEAMIQGGIDRIYGGLNGIEGILQEKIIDLLDHINNTMDLDKLAQTPAAALGSCRFKLAGPEEDTAQYRVLIDIFRKYDISYFIYIGGNDSMDTVDKLARYCRSQQIEDIKIIGAPKTIDNDLMEIDHCPGLPQRPSILPPPSQNWRGMWLSMIPSESPLWKSWDATPDGSPPPRPFPG